MLRGQLLKQALKRLESRDAPIAVRFWDGQEYQPSRPASVRIHVNTPKALKALAMPSLGRLARAYVEQEFDVEGDLHEILRIGEQLCAPDPAAENKGTSPLAWLRQTRPAARKNIGFHYDVSNEFFSLWLDSRRVYSCAYFRHEDDTLDRAQEQKLDLICRKLMLREGERLLDIGCGWGGLIFWAAEHYGVNSLGITLSKNQFEYVDAEIKRRGLGRRVEVRCLDYRELGPTERFDKVASVGMFEHVGSASLDAYFRRMHELLLPGGLAMNHGITSAAIASSGLGSGISEFIEDYVFPGGELVHLSRVVESASRAGLECVDAESLRPHYARTLWQWVERLEANSEQARKLAGEKRFRVWRIYMAGSAHAFARGWLSLSQVLAGKPRADGTLPYPYTRDHIYVSAPRQESRIAVAITAPDPEQAPLERVEAPQRAVRSA
jgi:cyclopropane-fatty-acyl-phospholipid synthase